MTSAQVVERQSPTTVFLRTTLTWTITLYELVSDIIALIVVFWSAGRERSRKDQHI